MMPTQDEHDIIGTKSATPSISKRRDDAPQKNRQRICCRLPPIFVHLGRLSNRLDNKRKKRGCPPLLLYVFLCVEFLRHTNSFRSSQNDNSPLDTRFKRRSLSAKGQKKKERMSQSQTPGNHGGLENIEIKTLPPGSKMIRVGAFFCEERGAKRGDAALRPD